MSKFLKAPLLGAVSGMALLGAQAAYAQTSNALRDEIVVTGTKKAEGVNLQDAPVAVTAFGEKQLEALHVRDLNSLSYSIPNVSLEDIGTVKGTANFSIRGLGINSSIPSIDPTVGVFADGVYLGVNAGVVLDIFDLESVEVLRGPQGILFGRNVTGGAVLINTKKPTDIFEASFKGAVESGLRGTGENYYAMGSMSGPLIEDRLKAKIAAYYNKDDGYFKNFAGGAINSQPDEFNTFGESKTYIFRPSIVFTPNDRTEFVLRYEYGSSEGDGPASQNHTGGSGITNPFSSFDRNTFDFSVDEIGFYDHQWNQITLESNWDVDFGNGTITNIFGYRDFSSTARSDIDATSRFLFHASVDTEQDQWSNELRYSGRFFDRLDITTGLYYFTQDIAYAEIRNIAGGAVNFHGGGIQDHETYGAFAQGDYDLNTEWTLSVGGRYTHEEKSAQVATLIFNRTPCNVIAGTCPFDFDDTDSWSNFSPKVGLSYDPGETINFYGHWTRGFRSGGYNFRNTSAVFDPGPFDREKVDAFEVGFKTQANDVARINTAFFYNDISNMQREVNLADPVAGVVQIIRNTADATIWGFETEAQFFVSDNLTLLASLGRTNGDYGRVLFDLSGDGVVDQTDEDLRIPRLTPWTYSAGFVYTQEWSGVGTWNVQSTFSHRDGSAYTDNNLGLLNGANIWDFNIGLTTQNQMTVALYGKNMLNEVTHGGDTQLPASLGGGAFAPLNKGRIVGLEVKFDFN